MNKPLNETEVLEFLRKRDWEIRKERSIRAGRRAMLAGFAATFAVSAVLLAVLLRWMGVL